MLAEDLTKANLREGSPNLLQMASKHVGKQVTSESIDSCSAGEQGGTKNNQASSLKPRVLTMHTSGPCSSGGAAGGTGQDPNELRHEVSHLAIVISNEDEFTDNLQQIIPTEDAYLSYHNVCFNIKQFIEVLYCDLQVTIHQGLVEVQADILKAIANFVDNFHIGVTTLSAPQVCALLDHMHARCAGSHSFLAAIR